MLILAGVVVLLPLSLFLRDLGQLVFDSETSKQLIKENFLDQDFMSNLAQQTVQSMLQNLEQSDDPENVILQRGMAELGDEDWNQLTQLIAPAELLSETADKFVDAYASWLRSENPLPDLELDLSGWKANLRENDRKVVVIVLAALPECTLQEIAEQALDGLTGGDGLGGVLPLCRPPEPVYSQVLNNADRMVAGITEHAPDQINVSDLPIQNTDNIVAFKDNLNRARLVLNWSWLMVAGLGGLAVAMAARSWPSALRWSGRPLLFASLLTTLFGALILLVAGGLSADIIVRVFEKGPSFLPVLISGAGAGALVLVGRPLLFQGLALLVLSIVAIKMANTMDRRAPQLQEMPENVPHPVSTTPVKRRIKKRDQTEGSEEP